MSYRIENDGLWQGQRYFLPADGEELVKKALREQKLHLYILGFGEYYINMRDDRFTYWGFQDFEMALLYLHAYDKKYPEQGLSAALEKTLFAMLDQERGSYIHSVAVLLLLQLDAEGKGYAWFCLKDGEKLREKAKQALAEKRQAVEEYCRFLKMTPRGAEYEWKTLYQTLE